MSDPNTKPKKNPIGTLTPSSPLYPVSTCILTHLLGTKSQTTDSTTTITHHPPLESDANTHSEWIQSALSIIQDGREAELQHRQSVADMKAMAEALAMQAPFSKTVRAVLALVQNNENDAAGNAFVEGLLWDVIDELTGSTS